MQIQQNKSFFREIVIIKLQFPDRRSHNQNLITHNFLVVCFLVFYIITRSTDHGPHHSLHETWIQSCLIKNETIDDYFCSSIISFAVCCVVPQFRILNIKWFIAVFTFQLCLSLWLRWSDAQKIFNFVDINSNIYNTQYSYTYNINAYVAISAICVSWMWFFVHN